MLNSLIEETLILPLLEKLVSLAEIQLWEKIAESVKVQIKKIKAVLRLNMLLIPKQKLLISNKNTS